MDRCVALYNNKRYKAFAARVKGQITTIKLFLHRNEPGFTSAMSAYDKDLHEREVKKEEVSELYREYFIARYKNHEFFVTRIFQDDKEIEIVTADPNLGKECNLDYQDRDLYMKRLGSVDDFQLFYVKEDYLSKNTIRREVTIEECFKIETEHFE
ncbi:hypothetical protein [Neobacillus sp. SuZ13]|uniref:hypothetical protein n=1 Tax=Neobacillus sp. SuZ13 TaxID=3047875 RepID=UPI0024C04D18|nr:hypothetical protein [Neobacillus sp. SuZ13]WHY67418.1 hypothetical protein QNH17_01735 [Neobacillus sp. SuZ13]